MLIFSREKKTKLSYMIIIFYDNIASFKKSKLSYKLILGKQKQDSISNPVLVSASICSEWFIDFLFITRDSRKSNKLCGRKTTKQNDFTL